MATVHDVAQYILEARGAVSAMKLQKLLYYSQAWSLVWDESPLFNERIEAWANGPVIRDAYDCHRGQFIVSAWPRGSSKNLSDAQRDTIDGVLEFYGVKSAQWLSDLSHAEDPWLKARSGVSDGERSEAEITTASMHEYYSGLLRSRG